jgi:endoglucanase
MKEKLRQRIKEMTALIGVSGHEWDVSKYIYGVLKDHVDSIEIRPNGNLIAIKKGAHPGPRVLVSAHMDEVGYIVRAIDSKGFLYFDKIGGPSDACIPGRRVLVKGEDGAVVPGIIGVRAAHLLTPEEAAQPQTVKRSYIDIGAPTREAALALGIQTGAQVVIDSPCRELSDPDNMNSRAMDCRVLCSIIVETMLRLRAEDIHGEICAVFTVLEESSTWAAMPAVNMLQPEYGLFLDTIPTGDVPDGNFEREVPVGIGLGPVIIVSQQWQAVTKCVATHPKLLKALRQSAAATETICQEFAFNGAGFLTDASTATHSGFGIATATMGVPRRFSHSPVELINLNDAVGCQKVVEQFLKTQVDLTMF